MEVVTGLGLEQILLVLRVLKDLKVPKVLKELKVVVIQLSMVHSNMPGQLLHLQQVVI
jgi:hypothetical protein